MNDIEFDKEFYDQVDEFIRLANTVSSKIGDEKTTAVINFAASRYSAYLTAFSSKDLDELKALRDESIDYFLPIYKSNLKRNLNHFEANYDLFVSKYREDKK